MDPNKHLSGQQDTRVICNHCNQLFPSPEALWIHRQEIRANTNTTPTTPHLLVNGKMSSMHQHNRNTSVTYDTLFNQHYMYLKQRHQEKKLQNNSKNTRQATPSHVDQNNSKAPLNTPNESLQNQQSDSLDAQMRTVRYFQQNHLKPQQNADNNQINQDKTPLKAQEQVTDANTNNFYQNLLKPNLNSKKTNDATKANLQIRDCSEDSQPNSHNVLKQEQTIIFEDRNQLHKLLSNDQIEAQKAQTGTKKDQIILNNAFIRPENTENASEHDPKKVITPTTKTTKSTVYDVSYKCRLCGANFAKKGLLMRHISNLHDNKTNVNLNNHINVYKKTKVVKPLMKVMEDNKISEDNDVTFVPQDSRMAETLPRIVSVTGNNQPILKNQTILSAFKVTADKYLEKDIEYIPETRQDQEKTAENQNLQYSKLLKVGDENKRAGEPHNLTDEYDLKVRYKSNTAENKKQRKRKDERKDFGVDKKRAKLGLGDTSSTSSEEDSSDDEQPRKTIKTDLRKPKRKNKKVTDSSSDENSQSSSDTDKSQTMFKLLKKCLNELIFKTKVLEQKDYLEMKRMVNSTKTKSKTKSREKIYKCKKCTINFIKEKTLQKHLKKGNHNEKKKRCVICRLKFSKQSIKKHIEKHHMKMNLKLKDFDIITNINSSDSSDTDSTSSSSDNDSSPTETPEPEPSTSNDYHVKRIKNNIKTKPKVQTSADDSENFKILRNNKLISQQSPDTDEKSKKDNYKTKIYRCDICDICFFSHINWENHMTLSNHKPLTKTKCTLCDLSFTRISLDRHITLHHIESTDQRKLEIISSKDKESIELDNVVSRLKYKANEVSNKLSTAFKHQMYKLSKSYSKTVYQCRLCKVYFLTYAALVRHVYMRRHDRRNVARCSMCGLSFYRVMVERHIDIHHKKLRLKDKSEFQVKILPTSNKITRKYTNRTDNTTEDEDDCYKATRSQRSSEKVNHMIQNDPRRSKRKKGIQLASIKQQIQEQEELEKEHRQQITDNDLDLIDDRLYKCSQCNLHYIKKQSLIYHMEAGRHNIKKLHPCPVCRHTFSVIYLRKHIAIQHFKLRIEKFKIETSTQDDDDRTEAINPCRSIVSNINDIPLKDCVVQLTSLQSALVSTTSNDGMNYVQQPQHSETNLDVTTGENSSQSDVYTSQQNVDNHENNGHDNDNIVQIPNTNSESTNVQQVAKAGVVEVINENKNDERLETEEITHPERKVESRNTVIVPNIKILSDVLIKAEKLVNSETRSLMSMGDAPIYLESDTSCESDNILTNDCTSEVDNKDGKCSEQENEDKTHFDPVLSNDIVNKDNAEPPGNEVASDASEIDRLGNKNDNVTSNVNTDLALIKNNQDQKLAIVNDAASEKELLNKTNTIQKPHEMLSKNENEPKRERINIGFPNKSNNTQNFNVTSKNIDLSKTCQDMVELNNDFKDSHHNLDSGNVKVIEPTAVDGGINISNVDIIEKTIQNIKQERDDEKYITFIGTDEVIIISDDDE